MASKRRLRRKQCEHKIRFEQYWMADWQARKARHRYNDFALHAYHCRFGDHYHIGHQKAERPHTRDSFRGG